MEDKFQEIEKFEKFLKKNFWYLWWKKEKKPLQEEYISDLEDKWKFKLEIYKLRLG